MSRKPAKSWLTVLIGRVLDAAGVPANASPLTRVNLLIAERDALARRVRELEAMLPLPDEPERETA